MGRSSRLRSATKQRQQSRVHRQFVAERPDQLWCVDFTYVSTWEVFAYVAFIIDVFAGMIVGGGSHHRWRRRSSWMHWSRRYGLGPSITVIKARSMSLWHTPNGYRTTSCWHKQAVQATLTVMQWPKVSTVFTKRRRYTVRAGKATQK